MIGTGMWRQGTVVEAVLSTVRRSVEISLLVATLEYTVAEVGTMAEWLATRYAEANRGIQLFRLGDAWQFGTRREFYDTLIRVVKESRRQILSQVVLETLTIVAYRQPVTKMEIAKIRGVSSDHVVNKLVEYGLICEAGRLGAPGYPTLLTTTEELLRRFGVDFRRDLSSVVSDQGAEVQEEVKRELNYHFGTEEGKPGEDSEDGD